MKLYHVSFDLTENRRFSPRIPESRSPDEDNNIARICASETIEGALSAIPYGGSELDMTLAHNQWLIKLFIFDTEKLNISENKIMDYNELYEKDLVIDAYETKEYWILEDVEIPKEDAQILYIKTFEYESADYVPYFIQQEVLGREDGDLEEVWENYFPFENIPCITKIVGLEYEIIDLENLKFKPYTNDWYDEKYDLKIANINEDSYLIECPLNSFLIAREMKENLKEFFEGMLFIKEWV